MAKSKGKIELQIEIKTQDQWDELLSKEGLILVDTYSAWCGPCKAIVSSFKRLKNELGDDLLVFATAETDSIETLEAYRMKSQPTFLFYAGGILVNVVRGCNCPLLIKTIRNELDREHKVMDGKADRVPFVDQEAMKEPDFEEKQDEEKDVEEEEEEIAERMTRTRSRKVLKEREAVELPKQVTVAIIKPDAVKAGLVDEIIQKVEESGMEVLRKEEKIISKEEAAEFYKQHEGSEHFDQLVEFMSSGPCMTLVLSKADEPLDADAAAGTIDYFRDLIGPKDVNIAKEEAPHSLRALYGTDTVMNAVHGCDSSESAARELAFFYPDFVAPTITKKRKKRQLQRTLALIRPDALRTRKESIINKIQEAGFTIAMSKEITLSKEQAEGFYSQHKDSEFFETLVTNMTSGPMMALCLAREDAVEGWRGLLGPKEVTVGDEQAPDSLRSQFHVEESPVNPLHGSDSVENAEKEIQQFFPLQSTVAVIKPDLEPDKREDIMQRIKEAGFKIQYEKEVTLDKELASQLYHEHEGKDFFQGLTDHMSSGPTLFMVLTREDAVSGWRALMGPTDPQEALEIAPDSLRAQFGLDMMKNAVHGSSNVEKAEEAIKEFFPEVEILPDGSVKVPEEEVLIEQGKAEEKDEIKEVEQPKETYSEPLGMESGIIPDEAIKASSVLDDQHDASKARLKTKPEGEQVGAWVPLESDENQWLQVDLGKVTRVTKIASQGESGESVRRVKGFSLSYNLTEEEFVPYSEDGAVKVFEGNSDQDTIVYSELRHPVIAQYVRLNPKEWSEGIALRTEFYGCDAETYSAPLGMESGTIPDEAIKASSVLDDQHNASKARLKTKPEGEQVGAWVPLESDENQWLQVDLGKVVEVAKVATQGSGDNSEHRVGSYTLLFSQDGEQFQSYGKDGEPKVFEGNSDGVSIVGHWLVEPFSARYCRLQPKTWNEQIALRVELFGKAPEEREAKDEAPSSQQVTSEEIVEKATEKEDDKQEELQAAKEGEVKSDEQEVSEKSDETDKTPQVEAERAETNPEVGEKEAEENKPEEAGESQVNEKEDSAVNKEVEESSVKPSGDDTADVSKPEGNEAVNASKPEGDEANVDASKPEGDGGDENKTTEGEGGQEEDSTVK